MKHEVKTDEEIAASGLLDDGVYDFTIVEAEETVSKAGKDMFKLKLNVFDTSGEVVVIRDWVLPDFPKKYKHLHDALGLLDLYTSGETKPSDLVDKSGKLMLGKGKPYTDQNGITRVNNNVMDYVKKANMLPGEKPALPKDVDEDSIPF